MAISVPLTLKNRNVFLSYNYEFNYYQPEHVYKYPPILMGNDWEDSYLTYGTTGGVDSSSSSSRSFPFVYNNDTKKLRPRRSLPIMSRTNFYIMLEDKLERSGYSAKPCLLRLICETNASTLGQVNGLLGSIVHIIFTPSSSSDENLDKDYYQAEWDGHRHGDCSSYASQCEENVLDLISRPLYDVLRETMDRRNGGQ
ncbi:uncharacterized protein LOC108045019 [Drosophila rhopaloa]|uniref:Uncharacterized protein LOC108045019 n=1 Tax=Drosophila rhopaloa TaxID=1041015 RepID=A0A6P4EN87_DRORH|nr:uncharacterized protein LOC108045019 [Drosophila rhopaloa]